MDSPSVLKESALPGITWDVRAKPLLVALDGLSTIPGVLRVGLLGDHLRAITSFDMTESAFLESLKETGIKEVRIEKVEPSLEDVFLSLAVKGEPNDNRTIQIDRASE
jgi:hypothetical protein